MSVQHMEVPCSLRPLVFLNFEIDLLNLVHWNKLGGDSDEGSKED